MYEKGVLDGSMPYHTILGGYSGTKYRKWYEFGRLKQFITIYQYQE